MAQAQTFVFSEKSEPHRIRMREILKSHPEVREFVGQKTPMTFAIILFCVGLQIGLSYFLREQPWWAILGVSYLVGAFVSHTLFVCIHEVSHNLVFRKLSHNVWAGVIANFPSIFPTAISFKNFHLKHHAFQGIHEVDADLPDWYEAKLINNYAIGKAIWLFMFPVFQAIRTIRCREVTMWDKWTVLNFVAQITFDVAIIYFFGWKAFAYLLLSFWWSVGLHPLGARWVQEHYLVLDKNQETFSYYGSLNGVNMNVGFHNEHHDFPSVPWNHLPKIKNTAPEFYDTLKYHTSFLSLFFRFIFDQEISLYNRILRKNRGKVHINDQSIPDIELLKAQ